METATKTLMLKTPFTLTGFTHELGFRVFAFERVGADRVRTDYVVRADLTLTRKYGIPVQDLPLLCRALLEKSTADEPERVVTFVEDEMRNHVHECAAAKDS